MSSNPSKDPKPPAPKRTNPIVALSKALVHAIGFGLAHELLLAIGGILAATLAYFHNLETLRIADVILYGAAGVLLFIHVRFILIFLRDLPCPPDGTSEANTAGGWLSRLLCRLDCAYREQHVEGILHVQSALRGLLVLLVAVTAMNELGAAPSDSIAIRWRLGGYIGVSVFYSFAASAFTVWHHWMKKGGKLD